MLIGENKTLTSKKKFRGKKKKKSISTIISMLIITIIIQLIINIYLYFRKIQSQSLPFNLNEHQYHTSNETNQVNEIISDEEKIENIDTNLVLSINNRLGDIIEITHDERKYLNGMVRKFKPKKLVEIGVSGGGRQL
jgi:flagellar basal body-associated protein FliL